ncbi:MAG: heme ABC transporter ATP-binding protein [Pseudomonadota bacterium]
MISALDVSVRFGRREVVKSVELKASAKGITAIIGPNGSGKTSLLRALSGEVSYSGDVTINSLEVKGTPAWRLASERAVLPQFSNVTFPFTVREIISLGIIAKSQRVAGAAENTLPERALAKVGLSDFCGRRYHELSGGEQQRVQFARVLAQVWEPVLDGIPRWLFLDEPISSLDIQHQLTIMNIARDFAKSGGGVVAILHDLNLAAMYADQIVLMKDGEILSDGTPQKVLTNALLKKAFDCDLKVGKVPTKDQKFILPQTAQL